MVTYNMWMLFAGVESSNSISICRYAIYIYIYGTSFYMSGECKWPSIKTGALQIECDLLRVSVYFAKISLN